MLSLPACVLQRQLFPWLDEKDLARVCQSCKTIYIHVIKSKRWEDFLKMHFPHAYKSSYQHLDSSLYYNFYCIEKRFSVLTKERIKKAHNTSEECLKQCSHIVLCFTVYGPLFNLVTSVFSFKVIENGQFPPKLRIDLK